MMINHNGSEPRNCVPEDTFTGDVQIDSYTRHAVPSRLVTARVSFSVGARTPWKINPMGQTLIVTSGRGVAQAEGEPAEELTTGDIVHFLPGQRHWEGATTDSELTYIAVQEEDGDPVLFGARVTEDQHRAALRERPAS